MAYIPVVHETHAEGRLAQLYKRFCNPDGTVDNVLKIHSLNPESLEAHCSLYVQSMHRPSPVSRIERELIAVTVSRINGCNYCEMHHSAGLQRLLPEDRKHVVEEFRRGDISSLTRRESAMVQFAQRLTREPRSIRSGDVERLREAGLSDREILDVTQVAAYFAYANRMVLGLGAELEDEAAIGQWPKPTQARMAAGPAAV